MSFKFKIDDIAEVYRDPLGHYHHYAMFSGYLLEGTMRIGDFIKLPLADGTSLVAYIREMTKFAYSVGTEMTVRQVEQPFTLIAWRPVPSRDEIVLNIATDVTAGEAKHNQLETLANHPYRIFHNRGKATPTYDCGECASTLSNNAETIAILKHLQTVGDSYLVRRAAELLKRWTDKSKFTAL